MTYDYDMLGTRIHQASMEAGERWMLNDVTRQSRSAPGTAAGHNFRTAYDALRRPTGHFVQGTDAVNSDPRTIAAEVLFQKTRLRRRATRRRLNLRTRVVPKLRYCRTS